MLNFQNVPLFVSEDNQEITGELGDVFTLEIIETDLTSNAEIEIEIQRNNDEKVKYLNKMDTFDLIVFTDWEYWKELVTGYNIIFDETEEYFEFQVAYSNDGLVYYLVTRYDKQTGIFVYQLIYVTLDRFIDTPIAFVEIEEGDPLPQPDKSKIDISFTDFYQYELTQLIGYDDKAVLNGTEGKLMGKQGDVIEVLVVNEEMTQNRELLLAVRNGNNTISYLNNMDFLNNYDDIGFFVFTDWDYMKELVEELSSRSSEFQSVDYLITDTEFSYIEEFWNGSDIYYNIELKYDLQTGVLLYEALYFENFTSSEISILEINQVAPIQIDTSLLSPNVEKEYLFIVDEFNATDRQPVFSTSTGNVWLFEDDIFGLTFDDSSDNDTSVMMSIFSLTQKIDFNNSLTTLGQFAIYPDWSYWNKYVDFVEDFTGNNTIISTGESVDEFSFTISIKDNVTNYNYSTVYEKSTGVINQISINYEILEDNDTKYLDLLINRYDGPKPEFSVTKSSTLIKLDTKTSSEENTEDETYGFEIIGLVLGLVVLIRFNKKLILKIE
jgi:hypothetical protein